LEQILQLGRVIQREIRKVRLKIFGQVIEQKNISSEELEIKAICIIQESENFLF
jgi:hypothetical protein